jgi:hypothetical protein
MLRPINVAEQQVGSTNNDSPACPPQFAQNTHPHFTGSYWWHIGWECRCWQQLLGHPWLHLPSCCGSAGCVCALHAATPTKAIAKVT